MACDIVRYEKLRGQPEWAKLVPKSKKQRRARDSDSSSDEDDEEEGSGILQRTGNLLEASTEHLPRGFLDLKRMKDANRAKKAAAVIRAVEFHPSANVVLVGGYHKTLDLFQVDGQTNPKLQSVHIPNFPISTAHFSQDGKEVVLAGHRRRFYVYDMMAGKITPIRGIRGQDSCSLSPFLPPFLPPSLLASLPPCLPPSLPGSSAFLFSLPACLLITSLFYVYL